MPALAGRSMGALGFQFVSANASRAGTELKSWDTGPSGLDDLLGR
jgi:hypothetical protein